MALIGPRGYVSAAVSERLIFIDPSSGRERLFREEPNDKAGDTMLPRPRLAQCLRKSEPAYLAHRG